jgi:hypothetical protein
MLGLAKIRAAEPDRAPDPINSDYLEVRLTYALQLFAHYCFSSSFNVCQ